MTRNVEMEISLLELILSVKRRWKTIVIIGIICALLGGIAGFTSERAQLKMQDTSKVEEQKQEKIWYDENKKMYEESDDDCEEVLIRLRETWLRLAKMQKEHPLMEVDPYHCEWENIVVRFEADSGNHIGTVFNWIQTAEAEKLFGDSADRLQAYRTDLITADDKECETTITVIKVDGFDTEEASRYLQDHIQKEAEKSGITLSGISAAHSSGYLYRVADFIKYTRDTMNTVHGTINNVMNVTSAFPQPQEPEEIVTAINMTSVVKTAILGLLLGLIAGAAIMMVVTLKQGRVISRRQMEDTFTLEQLRDCSREHATSFDILNANLDVMTGGNSRILLLASEKKTDVSDIAEMLNAKQEREFVTGKDIIDDSATIDALDETAGIVIAVKLGESRISNIQRIILRAKRLEKKVLGFIII